MQTPDSFLSSARSNAQNEILVPKRKAKKGFKMRTLAFILGRSCNNKDFFRFMDSTGLGTIMHPGIMGNKRYFNQLNFPHNNKRAKHVFGHVSYFKFFIV